MFGYATDETDECMPLSLLLAHKLMARLHSLRRSGELDWVLPTSKCQVTVEYELQRGACTPLRIHTVVLSTQHKPGVDLDQIRLDVRNHVIQQVVPPHLLDEKTIYYINPCGPFTIGGPQADAGLTGRKIIVQGVKK